ncbi:MAG TPA: SRPBCC domain-containing protein [Haliangiales bacterium]|nr:SRPBCC domain-containing protein [Haliangiales bacterium]
MRAALVVVVWLLVVTTTARADADKDLRKEVVVAAPVADVWAAWTTNAGARTFFARGSNIELKRGGAYEILFFPDAPPGSRGAEGLHVLAFVPNEMLSFEWNAPPKFPELRKLGPTTFVVVQLQPIGPKQTKVVLHQLGWGAGADWDGLYAYFDKAWDWVMGNLKQRFDTGPLDWAAMVRK